MTSRRPLVAVSVDLDEVGCYAAIHGLDPGRSAHAIYDHAVPRLAALFASENIPATFFVVGLDVERNAARLRSLHDTGHELASHSHHHRYDLTRLPRERMRDDVCASLDALEDLTGIRPVGFRAPGYTINDTLLDVLHELGLAYDSSVFPCPAYYAAKSAVIGLKAVQARLGLGRASRSIIDDPRVLLAPADPYTPGRHVLTPGRGAMVELPIGVTVGARLPFIGTSVALASERMAGLLATQMLGRDVIVFELHGIDLADATLDGLEWLAPHQPDLRRDVDAKARSLRAALRTLRDGGCDFVTTAEAARRARRRWE